MNRVVVTVATELLLAARSVDDALDILKRTGFDGDACLWKGQQLVAVHFVGGSVLRLWPQGLPQSRDVTRN